MASEKILREEVEAHESRNFIIQKLSTSATEANERIQKQLNEEKYTQNLLGELQQNAKRAV